MCENNSQQHAAVAVKKCKNAQAELQSQSNLMFFVLCISTWDISGYFVVAILGYLFNILRISKNQVAALLPPTRWKSVLYIVKTMPRNTQEQGQSNRLRLFYVEHRLCCNFVLSDST